MSMVLRLMALLLTLSCGLTAGTVTWIGAGDGVSWSLPANWSPAAVPTAADDVIFANFVIVTVTTPALANSITGPGTLVLASTLTVTGTITGGSLSLQGGSSTQGSLQELYSTIWTAGAGNTRWTDQGNWNGNALPANGNLVIISSGTPYMPVIQELDGSIPIDSLLMESATTLGLDGGGLQVRTSITLAENASLNIGDDAGLTTGTLSLAGNVIFQGLAGSGAGTVVFGANTLNTIALIPSAAGDTVTIQDILIDGTNGTISVTGVNGDGGAHSLLNVSTGTIASDSDGQYGSIILNINDWIINGTVYSSNGNTLVLQAIGTGVFNSSAQYNSDFNPTMSTDGGTLTVTGGSWSYSGPALLYATNGTLNLGGSWHGTAYTDETGEEGPPVTTASWITANGSTVNLGGTFLSLDASELAANTSDASVYLLGTMDNTVNDNSPGDVEDYVGLDLNQDAGIFWALSGGTIVGGLITDGTFYGTDSGGTMSGVTIDQSVNFELNLILNGGSAATCTVTGGLIVNGEIDIGQNGEGESIAGIITWSGSQVWDSSSGDGEIYFASNSYTNSITESSSDLNATLTVGPGLSIDGQQGAITTNSTGTLLNEGFLAADGGSLSLNVFNWINIGQIEVNPDSALYITMSGTGINEAAVNIDGILSTGSIYAEGGTISIFNNGSTPWINTVQDGVTVSPGGDEVGSLSTGPWNDLTPGGTGIELSSGTTLQATGPMTTTQLMQIVYNSSGLAAVDIYGLLSDNNYSMPLDLSTGPVWTLEDGATLQDVEIGTGEGGGSPNVPSINLNVVGNFYGTTFLEGDYDGVIIDQGVTVTIEQGYGGVACNIDSDLTINGNLQIGVDGTNGFVTWTGGQSWNGYGNITFGPPVVVSLDGGGSITVLNTLTDVSSGSENQLSLNDDEEESTLTISGGYPQIIGDETNTFTIVPGGSATITTLSGDSITIGSNAVLDADGGTVFTFNGGAWQNNGQVSTDTLADSIVFNSPALSENDGQMTNSGSLTITGGQWSNGEDGTITAVSGSTLSFGGTWSNAGTINDNGALCYLGGSFTTATVDGFQVADESPSCTFYLVGSMNNAGGTGLFDLSLPSSGTPATWTLLGGTVSGGTITNSAETEAILMVMDPAVLPLINPLATSNQLANVTIGVSTSDQVIVSVQNPTSTCLVSTALTVNTALLVGDALGHGGSLTWNGLQTWNGPSAPGHTGTIAFGTSSNNVILDGNASGPGYALTFGPALIVAGGIGTIHADGTNDSLVNQGTISTQYNTGTAPTITLANPDEGTLAFDSNTLTNLGTISIATATDIVLTGNYVQNSGTLALPVGVANAIGVHPVNALSVSGNATLGGAIALSPILNQGDQEAPATGFVALTYGGTLTNQAPSIGPAMYAVDFSLDASSVSGKVLLHVIAPVVAVSPTGATNIHPTFTVTFPSSVTFDPSTFTYVGCTAPASQSITATTYSFTATPTANGAVSLTVPAGLMSESFSGLWNVASNTAAVTYDVAPLTASITTVSSTSTSTVIPFTIVYSAAVATPLADTTGGMTAALTSGIGTATVTVAPAPGTSSPTNVYIATVTLTGAQSPDQVTLTVPTTSASDAAGNQLAAPLQSTVDFNDTTNPTVTLSPLSGVVVNSSVVFNLHFSVPVIAPLNNAMLFTNGTGTLGTVSGSGQDFTVQVTPLTPTGTVTFMVLADATVDSGTGTLPNAASAQATITFSPVTASTPVTATVTPPAVTANTALPLVFTITFSAPVTGLTLADLMVTNGVATDLQGSGATYTVDITPTGNGPVSVAVLPNIATDSLGTGNLGSPAATVIYHTPPVPTLAYGLNVPVAAATIPITITFDEPVSGFSASGVVLSGAAVTSTFVALSASSYTLTVTPTIPVIASVIATIPAGVCQDSIGNANVAATVTIPLQSTVVSTGVVTPVMQLSPATSTVFNSICPGTASGLSQLQAYLTGAATNQTRAFVWDAQAQQFVAVPGQQPTGGWQPYQGVFFATRMPNTFNFNGFMTTFDFTLTLAPGWNFIGIPPLYDGTNEQVSHDWNNDLQLEDTTGAIVSDRASLIDVGAYAWNGTDYFQTTTLQSGLGYWINNASNPPVNLVLRRLSPAEELAESDLALKPAHVRAVSIGYQSHGNPPQPPSGSGDASGSSHGCGLGSGIGAFLTGVFLLLRLRLRVRARS